MRRNAIRHAARLAATGVALVLMLARCTWPAGFGSAPSPTVETACVWQWASVPLPELSASLTAVVQQAGQTETVVKATAYGENCLNGDGSVRYFAAMETDYDLAGVAAPDALKGVLAVLIAQAEQGQAGSNPGWFTVTLERAPGRLHFDFARASRALEQGLHDNTLIEALEAA